MIAADLAPVAEGAPQWLVVAGSVAALLVGVFGRGFVGSVFAWVRNRREGVAVRETEARQQEREYRAEQRSAAEQETERAFARLGQQLEDQGETIERQGREIAELREAVRAQFIREQQTMAGLTHHAGWDFLVKPYLPDDFPEPPPLLPPRDQRHSVEWGQAPG